MNVGVGVATLKGFDLSVICICLAKLQVGSWYDYVRFRWGSTNKAKLTNQKRCLFNKLTTLKKLTELLPKIAITKLYLLYILKFRSLKRRYTAFEAEVIPVIICPLSVSGVEESNYKLMKHEHRGLQNTGNYEGKRPVNQCLQWLLWI